MKKLSYYKKTHTFGGSATTMAWVAILGMSMLFSAINTFISNITSTGNNTSSNKSNYYSRSSTFVRMSPYPSRSAVNLWI